MTQAILTVGNIFADAFEGLMDLFRDMRTKAQKRHYTGKQEQNCQA